MYFIKSRQLTCILILLIGTPCLTIAQQDKNIISMVSDPSIQNSKILQAKIKQALKKSGVPASSLSIVVADPQTVLYELNARRPFNPASLTKILTASALLDLLSPSLQFKTEFLSKHKVNNSLLKGDLYLKGGGDPSFVSESLWNLVNNLSRTGVRTIQGNLIVDDSRFDSKKQSSRLKSFSRAPYNAPVGALSFNWNTANIYVRPGEQPGHTLKLHIDPSSLYFSSVKNQTKTATNHQSSKNKIRISIQKHKNTNRESLKITGEMPLSHKEQLIYKNISYPALWTGWNTVEFLKQKGIKLTGRVNKGVVPSTAHVLAEWKGKTLSENIRMMMKYSNNFIVDMLVKNLAVEKNKKPGSLSKGLKIIKEHIKNQLGISNTEYQLEEASGLSRQNRFQALHLLKAFQYWHHHPLQPEFESAFAIAGQDGTLKKRFVNNALQAKMYAKTGSLNGVSGLAGFFKTKQANKIFFIFLFNGSTQHQQKAELLLDTLSLIIFHANK